MNGLGRLSVVSVIAGCLLGGLPGPTAAHADPVPAGPAQLRPQCSLAGTYRLRHRSNGTEGWWLRLQVKGAPEGGYSAEILERASMLGLPAGPIQLAADAKACTLVLMAKTPQAGELRIALSLAPETNTVSGELTRTKTVSKDDSPAPVAGVRDVGKALAPACLRPGVFALTADPAAKWKVTRGRPFPGDGCSLYAGTAAAVVRIEPLGQVIVVDGAEEVPQSASTSRSRYEQGSARAEVKRLSECEISLRMEIRDFLFHAKLKLAGDKLTGVASSAEFQVFNDGEAGENQWKCGARNVTLTGARIAD